MTPSLQQHMKEMNLKLQTNYIRVDQEWLFEYEASSACFQLFFFYLNHFFCRCVEHFFEEEPNISLQDLYNKTLEQWLLNDLGEIGVGCLPDSVCNDTGIHMLNERYPLQMQYVLDIGKFFFRMLVLGILEKYIIYGQPSLPMTNYVN